MNERCQRICGKTGTACFISNRKQLKCIADMILNKVSISSLILESAIEEDPESGTSGKAALALKSLDELVNWIKFLQMAHDLRETIDLFTGSRDTEHRKEIRYPLPEIYQKYIGLHITGPDGAIPVQLINFSRTGMQFRSPVPFAAGSVLKGIFFTERHPIDKEVSFVAAVKHCAGNPGRYLTGIELDGSHDETSMDFFLNVHDFIVMSLASEK